MAKDTILQSNDKISKVTMFTVTALSAFVLVMWFFSIVAGNDNRTVSLGSKRKHLRTTSGVFN